MIGFAFYLVIAGSHDPLQSSSLTGPVAGIGVMAVWLYLAAATPETIPPLRDRA
jgi:hypothetical protein